MADAQDPYSLTLSTTILRDVQPQVQGGNDAITQALTQTLAQYDPTLAPNVTEGLKFPETTGASLAALMTNTTPEQKAEVLNTLAPYTSPASHYAFRNPQVEYDVSLINQQAIADLAKQQQKTRDLAAGLMQRGEIATSDSMRYLADMGLEGSQDALKATEQMWVTLQHLDTSKLDIAREGDQAAAVLYSPHVTVPVMQAIGPVDENGIWHPKIDGFAIGTPAQQQMMEQFNTPKAKADMAGAQLRGIAPVFNVTAPPNLQARPPTALQTRQSVPSLEEIEMSPEFQQMSPQDQALVRSRYFDEYVATRVPIKEALRADPSLYGPLKQEGTKSLTQRVDEMTSGLPTGLGILGRTAHDVALAGEMGAAAIKGATQGLLPWVPFGKDIEQRLASVAGEHPFVEGSAQMTTDLALGGLVGMPIVGGSVMSGVRSIADPASAGLPFFNNAVDLAYESIPGIGMLPGVENDPTSRAAFLARAALGFALINKATPYGVHGAVGTVKGLARGAQFLGRRPAAAVARVVGPYWTLMTRMIRNILKRGSWSGKELPAMEKAMSTSNSAAAQWLVNRAVEDAPDITVVAPGTAASVAAPWGYGDPGKVRLIMHDTDLRGVPKVVDPRRTKAFRKELDKVLADPDYVSAYAERPFIKLATVKEIQGTQREINAFFKANGAQHLEVEGPAAVKGVKLRAVGDKVHVVSDDGTVQDFPTWAAAREYVQKLPIPPTRAEDKAFRDIALEGQNPWWLTANFKNMAEWQGEVPSDPQWPQLISEGMMRRFYLPKDLMMDIERVYKIPAFSKVWAPMEEAVRTQRTWMAEPAAQLEQILGKRSLWQYATRKPGALKEEADLMQGYTHLMETKPGSPEWNGVLNMYKLDAQKGQQLRTWFEKVLPQLGLDTDEFLTQVLPRVQKFGLKTYAKGELPKSMSFFAEAATTGALPLGMRELDARTLAWTTLEQGSWQKWVNPSWIEAAKELYRPSTQMNPHAVTTIELYLRTLKGWGTETDQAFMTGIGKWTKKLLAVRGEVDPTAAEQLGKQVYHELMALQGSAYFGWRPATVTRQTFQTFQNIYPRFGGRATYEGIKDGLSGKYAEQLKLAGITATDFNAEGGVRAMGTKILNAVDMKQRQFAALAQRYLWDRDISKYIGKTMEWDEFAARAELNVMHPLEQKEIKALVDSGQALKAKYTAMRTASLDTNFDYSLQNRAAFSTETRAGRMFGQFSVFPVANSHYILNGLTRGTWGDRSKFLARWLGANYALQQTFHAAFGADASNYLFLGPLGFKGGALYNWTQDLWTGATGSGREAEQARKHALWGLTGFVPGSAVLQDVVGTVTAPTGTAARRKALTGFPADKETKKIEDRYLPRTR